MEPHCTDLSHPTHKYAVAPRFDGMVSSDGQLVMAPTVSGSGESAVRCDGPNSQTPMTAFIRLRRQLDVPAARNGTQGRHIFRSRPSAGIFVSVA